MSVSPSMVPVTNILARSCSICGSSYSSCCSSSLSLLTFKPCFQDPASCLRILGVTHICHAALLTISVSDTRLMPGRMEGWVTGVAGNVAQQRATVRAQASARERLQLYQGLCADQAPGVHIGCMHCDILNPAPWACIRPHILQHVPSG